MFVAVADRTLSPPKCLCAPFACFRSLFCRIASPIMPSACQSCRIMTSLTAPLSIHLSLGVRLTGYCYQSKTHCKTFIQEFFLFAACGTMLSRSNSAEVSCLLSGAFFSCGSFALLSRFWPRQISQTFHAKVITSSTSHSFNWLQKFFLGSAIK